IHCTYDPLTRGGDAPDGRKVKATIHWVSAKHSIGAEVRLYEKLFLKENPLKLLEGEDFKDSINPNSLKIIKGARLEPSLAGIKPGEVCQFERLGYFCVDSDTNEDNLVFNRTVTLKDEWEKIKKKRENRF
ncbi:MAG: glutamine--tRNA ligase, partial [Actinobacteria bacterium]|nr:glutamine--tRNA ligase [Actinomycetota bacterium]